MLRRRRPLLGAAMLGGTYAAGRASQRAATRENEQEARLESLEQQPVTPAATSAPPAAGPAPTGNSLVEQLNQLSSLRQSGALSDAEFEAAKQKLLAG